MIFVANQRTNTFELIFKELGFQMSNLYLSISFSVSRFIELTSIAKMLIPKAIVQRKFRELISALFSSYYYNPFSNIFYQMEELY